MSDPAVVLAVGLLVAGVVGSFLPVVPGALLSLAGVYLYWWTSGYADPGLLALAALTVVCLLAVVADYGAGAVAARAGGASWRASALGVAVGTLLFFVVGPVGLVGGLAGTVFLLTYRKNRDSRESARTALFAAVGVFASAAVQALLTGVVLIAMLLVVVL